MGLFDKLAGNNNTRAKPKDRTAARQEEVDRAKASAARDVLKRAGEAAALLPKKPKRKIALAMVKEAREHVRHGRFSEAAAELDRALGKAWGNKLRSATQVRRTRKRGMSADTMDKKSKDLAARAKAKRAKEGK